MIENENEATVYNNENNKLNEIEMMDTSNLIIYIYDYEWEYQNMI